MKKLLFLILIISAQFSARADEGMWMPLLISQNYEAMQRMGLRLTAEQIYSINNSSMKMLSCILVEVALAKSFLIRVYYLQITIAVMAILRPLVPSIKTI